jgi:hypothetical protein
VARVPARLAVAAVLAAALALPATASARIELQKGIAGANLRMTKAQVRAELGTPRKIRTGRNLFGRWTEFVYGRVTVSFQSGNAATAVRTSSRRERTARGVGPGSPEAAVRARVAGVRCRTESGGFRHCWVGRFLPGRVVTDFRIRNGRVASVLIGYVLD